MQGDVSSLRVSRREFVVFELGGRMVRSICIVLLSLLLQGCARPSVHEPVTLTLLGQEWRTTEFNQGWQQELQQFTNETGSQVRLVVDNKLVAMPEYGNIGLLYYRTDLLRQYGYGAPPRTWDELASMAARIQAGERAKGKSDFWGFVWQGAGEGLTCNALEWQASDGGGRIIEEDKTISVNNPHAIRAGKRAARWVGSISPPSVVGYKEWDALNASMTGEAAFMRNWPTAYAQAARSPIRNKFDIALLPGGKAGRVGTLGGSGLAVSRFSPHPREAVELVRYLTRRDVQVARSRMLSQPPTLPELYDLPEVLEPNPRFNLLSQAFRTGIVLRPSNVTGKKYEEVTDAYIQAVHSVLTGEKGAAEAAVALEDELVRITGFKKGPPLEGNQHPLNRTLNRSNRRHPCSHTLRKQAFRNVENSF